MDLRAEHFFPRASRYDLAWVEEHSLGENVLYQAESLTEVLGLRPGMRVLDLGCGHAVSSIFLAREFGVQVWAVDRGIDPTDNLGRIAAHGCADRVFPLRADARALPLPRGYFDAIISIDAFPYFGTDERFLAMLVPYLAPGGLLGIADAFSEQEVTDPAQLPPELREAWRDGDWYMVHSLAWWRQHWHKTGLVEILRLEEVPGSALIRQSYVDRHRDDPAEAEFIRFSQSAYGQQVGFFRLLARRTEVVPHLEDEDGDVPY